MQILSYLKNRWVFLGILVIIFIVIVALQFFSDTYIATKQKGDDLYQSNQLPYNTTIIPGKSTKDETVTIIGSPVQKKDLLNNISVYAYKNNPNTNWYDQVYLQNGVVKLIKRMTNGFKEDTLGIDQVKNSKPDIFLQETNPDEGDSPPTYSLEIFTTYGIGIMKVRSEEITQIWYFNPNDVNEIINTYAAEENFARQQTP